jgi:hypothetical protein
MLVSAYVNVLNKVAIGASARVAFIGPCPTTVLNKDMKSDVEVNFLGWPDSVRGQRSKLLESKTVVFAVNQEQYHFDS